MQHAMHAMKVEIFVCVGGLFETGILISGRERRTGRTRLHYHTYEIEFVI